MIKSIPYCPSTTPQPSPIKCLSLNFMSFIFYNPLSPISPACTCKGTGPSADRFAVEFS